MRTAKRPSDRRVRRTTHGLKLALLELIDERGYDRITVRDITDRADVGRSTFYAHFTSKDDLLFAGFDRWLRSLTEAADSSKADDVRFRFSLPLLRHIREQRRFFQATIARGHNAAIRRRTTDLFAELAQIELDRLAPTTDRKRREGQAQGVAGAFLGLAAWWLNGESGLAAEVVDEMFQTIAGGIR